MFLLTQPRKKALKLSLEDKIKISSSYKDLPARFYEYNQVTRLPKIELIRFNHKLSDKILSINTRDYSDKELVDVFAGQKPNPKFLNISQVYAGHQFGHFSPRLGDGRAILLTEVLNAQKQRHDIHLKGSGATMFSRRGDGKSSLGPVVREYIMCEAMFYLGAPTTRALAVFKTGEKVQRETQLDGGLFARVASSHIRVGTFEYFASTHDYEGLKLLADYSIERHYPQILDTASPNKYIKLLLAVARNQSAMVSKWMSLGFIHGVMNTDNMLISGETIDYGPCAFMDDYSSDKVFSSIDLNKRYAYSNQIEIAKWNLYRFASTLIPIIDKDSDKAIEMLKESLKDIDFEYQKVLTNEMNKKIGLVNLSNMNIINIFLNELEQKRMDFTVSFKELTYSPEKFSEFKFYNDWKKENPSMDLMKEVNPHFIPRNHQVEMAIQKAYAGDFSLFNSICEAIKTPFLENEFYERPPTNEELVTQTFCGT